MNLTRSLRQLKHTRPLRPCLLFHDRVIGGIDVPREDFERVIALVRVWIKAFEANGFDVAVNHWGALYATPASGLATFELFVRTASPTLALTDLQGEAKSKRYMRLLADSPEPSLNAGFRVYRPNTQTVWLPLGEPNDDTELVQKLIHTMFKRLEHLVPRVRFALPDWRRVDLEDVLCVLRYCALATYGCFLKQAGYPFQAMRLVNGCTLTGESATLHYWPSDSMSYRLRKVELALMRRLVPSLDDGPLNFGRCPPVADQP
ncbi:hypothetical protein GCM10011352_04860 [Marinobacterium zhoushanense]|uniref:Uncharacterized protein n=1 Tax=Marinobacterium zhoushanense TaxID=1679163 RepID=A0ABQ1K3I0_9GAMM|nr:hypothetical protein [Marinobacterium zhoushanense]GGB82081.1 hypothetical protein GCM10011352_04860 [Marinobacterium zhoushanense]